MSSHDNASLQAKYKGILRRSIREFQYLGTKLKQSNPHKYAIWCKVAKTI